MNRILEAFPYLRVRDAKAAIAFYSKVFGAVEGLKLVEPSGRVGHAELMFGPHMVMVSDEYPEYGIRGPVAGQPTAAAIHIHVDDVNELVQRAVEEGAILTMPPADQFYGERSAKIIDPFGHEWMLGSHIEDVSPAEMQRRFTAMFETN
jgi:PhnB protein